MRYHFACLCLVLGLLGVYGYCYFVAARQSPRPDVPAARMIETKTKTTTPRMARPKPDGLDPTKPVRSEHEDVLKKALVLPPAPLPNPPPFRIPESAPSPPLGPGRHPERSRAIEEAWGE
jgi:hypothetical protein